MTNCGVRADSTVIRAWCGQLSVAEDPSKPSGRRIDINVAVVPATSPNPAPDAVFMLAGGPGGAAVKDMAWTVARYAGIHATHDIVLVDQRGTGGSNPIWFGNAPDVGGLTTESAMTRLRAFVAAEIVRLNADPAMYTTAIAMDDVDAVRAALGYDKIDLIGGSYGATAAQYYLRQHGDRVRAVVLDGASLIDVPLLEYVAPNSQRALNILFLRCAAEAACAAAFPDLAGDLKRAVALLAKGDVTSDVQSTYSGDPIVISTLAFAGLIHGGLLQSDTAANLPWVIHAAAKAQWHDVAVVMGQFEQPPVAGAAVMDVMIRCSEAWAAFDPEKVAANGAGSYLAGLEVAIAKGQALKCQLAPKGYVPANDATPATSTVPVLLVVGEADPQDPPANIADAGEDFPNSLVVIAPGQGHTVGHLGCLPGVIDAFIDAGALHGLDTSCVARMSLPPFKLP